VIVSTESKEIRETAESYGGNVPFERPAELATDDATNDEVMQHALDWFASRGESFEYICQVSVTAPFRTSDDIDTAVQKLYNSTADSIISVTTYDVPPFWAVTFDGERIEPYFDENPWKKTQTQDFQTLHYPNGALFAAHVPKFEEAGGFYTDRTTAYEMPQDRSVDIDEPFDLETARALFSWRDQ
jgi:CMP-N-acetylneuraminic acid synthetase